MDSDKVIVMDAGQAVEFGHPHELLQESNGFFSNMVKETGPDLEKRLRKVAEDDFQQKNPVATVDNEEQTSLNMDNTVARDQENESKTETSIKDNIEEQK